MKKFDIMSSIRREMNLKNLSSSRVAKKIGVSEIEITEFFLERNVSLELLEKVIEVVFESYKFQYSFKENPLKKFSTKELLEKLMRRQNQLKNLRKISVFFYEFFLEKDTNYDIIGYYYISGGKRNMDKYADMFNKEFNKYNDENQFPNILIIGKTGSGKSTLINIVFGEYTAKTSNIERGTNNLEVFYGKKYNKTINLIDSCGYELTDIGNIYVKKILSTLDELNIRVDLVWYIISLTGARFENMDETILKELERIPYLKSKIGIIITKCDYDDENSSMAKELKEVIQLNFSNVNIFEISSKEEIKLDMEKLIEWSANSLDDEHKKSFFIQSQKKSLNKKRENCQKYILSYSTGAAITGITPIPFSDSAILIPLQITMVAHICKFYGLDSINNFSKSFVSNLVISQLGKSIAGNLIKLIPFIGTAVGAIINGTVASAITYAIGMAVSEICYNTCIKISNGEEVDLDGIFDFEILKELIEKFLKDRGN